MSGWHTGPLAPFDTESTGLDLENERIVTVTVARINPGHPLRVNSQLIAVDIDIPEKATEVHGITTEHARTHGKPAPGVLDAAAADLAFAMAAGIPIVGCNLSYDFTLLDRELRRNNLPTLEDRLGRDIAPVVDVYVIDKAVDKYRRGGRKLVDLCATYQVKHDGAHDATADAIAAARVAWRIACQYPRIGSMALDELHALQIEWRREQQLSLADYFRKQGRTDDADEVDTYWPIRPYQPEQAQEVLVS